MQIPIIGTLIGFLAGSKGKKMAQLSDDTSPNSNLVESVKSQELWSTAINENIRGLYERNVLKAYGGGEYPTPQERLTEGFSNLQAFTIHKVNFFKSHVLPAILEVNPDFNHHHVYSGELYDAIAKGTKEFKEANFKDLEGKDVKIGVYDLIEVVPTRQEWNFVHQHRGQITNLELAGNIANEFQTRSQTENNFISAFLKLFDLSHHLNRDAVEIDFYEFTSQVEGDTAKHLNIKKNTTNKEPWYKFKPDKTRRAMTALLYTETVGTMQQFYGLDANALHKPGAEDSIMGSLFFASAKLKAALSREMFQDFSHYVLENFDNPDAKLPFRDPMHVKTKFMSIKKTLEVEYDIQDKSEITKWHLVDLASKTVAQVNNLTGNQRAFGGTAEGYRKYLEYNIRAARIDISPEINELKDDPHDLSFSAKSAAYRNEKFKFKDIYDFGTVHGVLANAQITSTLKEGTDGVGIMAATAPVIDSRVDPNMFKQNAINYDALEMEGKIKRGGGSRLEYIHKELRDPHSHAPGPKVSKMSVILGIADKGSVIDGVNNLEKVVVSKTENPDPKHPNVTFLKSLKGWGEANPIKFLGGKTVAATKRVLLTTTVLVGVGGGIYMVNKHFKDKAAEEYDIQWRKDHGLDKDSTGAAKSGVDVNGTDKEKNAKEDKKFPAVQKNPYEPGTPDYQNWRTDSVIYQNATSMNSEEVYKNKDYKLVKVGTELVMFSVKPVNNLENNKAIS